MEKLPMARTPKTTQPVQPAADVDMDADTSEVTMPSIRIDVDKLTIAAQIELEELRGARSLIAWLDRYADYDRDAVLALPVAELKTLGTAIGEQLTAAIEPGN